VEVIHRMAVERTMDQTNPYRKTVVAAGRISRGKLVVLRHLEVDPSDPDSRRVGTIGREILHPPVV
jgi:hypothetical protein